MTEQKTFIGLTTVQLMKMIRYFLNWKRDKFVIENNELSTYLLVVSFMFRLRVCTLDRVDSWIYYIFLLSKICSGRYVFSKFLDSGQNSGLFCVLNFFRLDLLQTMKLYLLSNKSLRDLARTKEEYYAVDREDEVSYFIHFLI